ncbi:HlyD family efflux transporter periplasmic adaptor subunit [Stenotrophomonas sp. HITSZ_GD]|uniref:HlyD family efflux transporter periplasmic adaptor subunit n=1 Tax=Stenotrophomonas sp. HITSZ_GD TaxID=3037248 RepID=UPI00240D2BB0|nr:HlyD family efflux transporter periplasmic adaptor subunit [Stenotrophomonas sp. HITSZ_GD]MDG2525890.1 HlyD family efflux transporter periplasmic adaptor subunit [Stenotrophomonas sp. HITSZ_GD]
MADDLFREEVLAARRDTWLGGIALARPLSSHALVLLAVAAALAIVLFLSLGTYTRRSNVIGQLVPVRGAVTVVAPVAGVVAQLNAEEGGRVRAGQALLRLDMPLATGAGADAIATLASRLADRRAGLESAEQAREEVLDTQARGLRAQREAMHREQAQVEEEIRVREDALALAQQSLARLQALHVGRYVSAAQVEQQQAAVLDQAAQLQAMRRTAASGTRALAQLAQALAELPGQRLSARADLRHALAQLAQEQVETEARGAQAITATVEGIVANQLVKAGQAVQAGQPLLMLVPADATLEAELWVPSRSIGFIAPGDNVMLRYQAYPYQKFGHQRGVVRRVGRNALGHRELQLSALGGNASEPYYRVVVALARQHVTAYGKAEPLHPGMLLEADILGERRRLIEWIFEPLYTLTGRVDVAADPS